MLIHDTEPRSCRRVQAVGSCGSQIVRRRQVTNGWGDRWGLRWASREGCGSRDEEGMVRKKTQRLSQSEAGAECVPQLLCCSPAPGNASDVGLSHRHTRPYCWYIQHMTDPVALSHEITRVHVTKVTYNESCSPPPFRFPFLLLQHLAITPPSLCYQCFTVKPPVMSNARTYQNHCSLHNLISALCCERICLWVTVRSFPQQPACHSLKLPLKAILLFSRVSQRCLLLQC